MFRDLSPGELGLFATVALGSYLLLFLIGRYLKRRHSVRFGPAYILFCLLAAVFLSARFLALPLPFDRELCAALILLGAWEGVVFLRRLVWDRFFSSGGNTEPQMLREVVSGLLLLIALVVVLKYIYSVEVPGLLAGSGIAAVVLGLALQDLLGNIIAGFALHFEKPFRVGDWLMIENRFAQVTEMNWRATLLRTNDDICLDIPNRELARQTIVNLYHPTALHAMRLEVKAEHDAPPSAVKDALLRAATNAAGVLPAPPPQIYLKDFGDHALIYEIKFWIDDQAAYFATTDAIRTNAWYELRRAGIKIPVSPSTVRLERARPRETPAAPEAMRQMLHDLPLFRSLDESEQETVLNGSRSLWYGRGEKIIRQDAPGESMFVLMRGTAGVMVDKGQGPKHIAVLRAGDCFGEMSLLTGEPRTATLVAREDCETLEITKGAVAAVLQHNPELSRKLSELLAHRQMEVDGALDHPSNAPEAEARHAHYRERFLRNVRNFFQL